MKIVALSGGVGGAKLAHGLQMLLGGDLTVIANTGDDFVHLGLPVSPDIDTLLYTLSGQNDRERGWGRAGETWNFMAALRQIGGPDWFNLGDRDLALHVERRHRMAEGEGLAAITAAFARSFGITARILPATEDELQTRVVTRSGEVLDFQHYFVRERCAPPVASIRFDGAGTARPGPDVIEALTHPATAAIVICPSNPLLSIDPILAVPAIRAALAARRVPSVAVSPLIGGAAIKGPTAKLYAELGQEPGVEAIARHYEGLIDLLLVDPQDDRPLGVAGVVPVATPILMQDDDDRRRLADTVLRVIASRRGDRG